MRPISRATTLSYVPSCVYFAGGGHFLFTVLQDFWYFVCVPKWSKPRHGNSAPAGVEKPRALNSLLTVSTCDPQGARSRPTGPTTNLWRPPLACLNKPALPSEANSCSPPLVPHVPPSSYHSPRGCHQFVLVLFLFGLELATLHSHP